MNFTQKSSFALIGKFINTSLGLIISVLLARYLNVSGVGQYQLLLSTQVLLITILAMGFGNASIFFINNKNIDRKIIINNLLKIFFYISLFLSSILGFSIYYFKEYFGSLNLFSIFFFVIGSGMLLLYNILVPVLYASLEIIRLQILGLSSMLLLFLGIITLNFLNIFNINMAIIIVGLSNIFSTLILLYYLKNDIDFSYKINFNLIKELFLFGTKISATNFVFILSSNIVIFLIKYYNEDEGFTEIGLFTRATSIANILIMLPTTLGPLFYSKWSKTNLNDLHNEVEKLIRIIIFITVISSIIIFLFGDYLITFLYGKDFIDARYSLSILSVSIIFSSITIILSVVFSSIGKPGLIFKVFMFSLLTTTFFSILLIPVFNINGAAIAVLIGILFNAIVLSYFSRKEINLSIKNSLIINKKDILSLKLALIQRIK